MPLLDYFRLPRFGKVPAPLPPVQVHSGAQGRLHRMLARQTNVRVPSEMEQRLVALESQYSEPLYDSSAYGSPPTDPSER